MDDRTPAGVKLVGIHLGPHMLEPVQVFIRALGIILLAAVWLPASLFFRTQSQDRCGSAHQQFRSQEQSAPAYATQPPVNGLLASHFRSSGFFLWFSMRARLDNDAFGISLNGLRADPANAWHVADAPPELLRKSYCGRPTASKPRAPCFC